MLKKNLISQNGQQMTRKGKNKLFWNKIHAIEPTLKNLFFYFAGNPIHCDGHMNWAFELRRTSAIYGRCHSPSEFEGQSLQDLIDSRGRYGKHNKNLNKKLWNYLNLNWKTCPTDVKVSSTINFTCNSKNSSVFSLTIFWRYNVG